MFRKTPWRNAVNEAVSLHQDQALNTTIFILKEFGPTGFLLKEEGEPKSFKACLGNPHTCTCPTYVRNRDLCKHICWLLIRKFRLPRDHEYCFQLGLADGQINEMLQDHHRPRTPRSAGTPLSPVAEEDGGVQQKEVEAGDVCPICQDDLLGRRLPVSYCRYGCGNNVHISCMKIWADHQTRSDTDTMVTCPLCREVYEPLKVLLEQVKNAAGLLTIGERERSDKHLGVPCNSCKVCPVLGKCFKCMVCAYYHLCEDCFNRHGHPQHPVAFRMKRSQRWVLLRGSECQKSDGSEERDANSAGHPGSVAESEGVPEQVVRSLLSVEVRQGSKLLRPGQQCRLCLKCFHLGQLVKHLPCHHKFHTDCADTWLRQSNCCPLDGHVIYNPLTWRRSAGKSDWKEAPPMHGQSKVDQLQQDLFIPGVGLQFKTAPGGVTHRTVRPNRSVLPVGARDMQVLPINSAHTERPSTNRGSADPEAQTKPPGRDARCTPPKQCHSPEHLRTEEEKLRSGTTTGLCGRDTAAKRRVKSLEGAALQTGTARPQQSLVTGLTGLEILGQQRGVTSMAQNWPQKKPFVLGPSPTAARERERETALRETGEEQEKQTL